ncbi:MAG: NmrA/HSCARG family protein [Elusimicrobia bacterium]|nr:NmrA/HSCARG family protein [Elusimicrobiota bacterium]
MSAKTVLVAGATGQQGGYVARALLKMNHHVRALTRKPESPAAQKLRKLGAEIVIGDFDDKSSLKNAMKGADAVFAMGTPFEAGVEAEIRQGIALAEAAYECAVDHLLYTSVAGADQNTCISHFDGKFEVEEHILSYGIPYTIIAPVFFMENLRTSWWLPGLREGRFSIALPPEKKLQMIPLENIGEFAAMAIDRPKTFLNTRIELASDEIAVGDIAGVLSDIFGCNIEFVQTPIDQVRAMDRDFALMFEWLDQNGCSVDIAGLRRDYPEVGWQTFKEWANSCDWSMISHLIPA